MKTMKFVAALSTLLAAAPLSAATIYVAPTGSDGGAGTAAAPLKTLAAARDAVRRLNGKMNEDIVVELAGGTYRLDKTLVLDERDGGDGKFNVVYRAAANAKPVISGGLEVPAAGWTPVAGTKQWQVQLPTAEKFRTLFVNGARARMASSAKGFKGQGGWGEYSPQGEDKQFVSEYPGITPADRIEPEGIKFLASDVPKLGNPRDVEIYSWAVWTTFRLAVEDIISEGEHTVLKMQQPYYFISQNQQWQGLKPSPTSNFTIQNAREYLDEPGEFYFDRTSKTLYYIPRAGEDLKTAKVVAPQLEGGLLKIQGSSPAKRVKNLQFRGLQFSHDNYLMAKVGNSRGASFIQGVHVQTHAYLGKRIPAEWRYQGQLIQPAVEVLSSQNIVFERNRFEECAGIGLSLTNDVQDVRVEGNVFRELGASSINIGHWEHDYLEKTAEPNQYPFKKGEEGVPTRVAFRNNLVRDTSIDFPQAPAVNAFYTDAMDLSHNDIGPTDYIGISAGWGWSQQPNSKTSQNNKINFNRINGAMQELGDGGGIYTLGQMPGTVLDGNYILYRDVNGRKVSPRGEGLYPDQGSAFQVWSNNVYEGNKRWVYMHTGNIHDNQFLNNWTMSGEGRDASKGSIFKGTRFVESATWPAAAQKIIDNAGLEAPFRDLLSASEKISALKPRDLTLQASVTGISNVPVTLETENYDFGGAEVAFKDADKGNSGGAYRENDVDIAEVKDKAGGFYVTQTRAGEWLEWSFRSLGAAEVPITATINAKGGGVFHLELTPVDKNGKVTGAATVLAPVNVPDTKGKFAIVPVAQFSTQKGAYYVLRLSFDKEGVGGTVGDFDSIDVGRIRRKKAPAGGAEDKDAVPDGEDAG